MSTRREFLADAGKGLMAGAVAATLPGCVTTPMGEAAGDLVVSTWNFGPAANAVAWGQLASAEHPLDAAVAGVAVTEADPTVNSVGYGGLPNAEGAVELDSAVMRGDTLQCGAVAALAGVMHPAAVARAVLLHTRHVLLVGEGALAFARAQGFPEQDLLTPASRAAWEAWKAKRAAGIVEPWEQAAQRAAEEGRAARLRPGEDHDTIGMIVRRAGRLATAVTTSGLAWKLPGRVGDSPILGAGSYCDDEAGACVSTGVGEEVIRQAGSFAVVEALRRGASPREAVREILARIRRSLERRAALGVADGTAQVAFIAVDRAGAVYGGALRTGFEYALTGASGTRLLPGEVL